ncbi:hypothetical protein [Paraflavitalea speifideaquila]|uniref:hypothetical protein n=1 Tax=Paraflavitalea speifideaquila TaxID=3076558 RepID=UPI0028ED6CC3|nr:hypothetical protein [Paraflavitalea speifideiaquila]
MNTRTNALLLLLLGLAACQKTDIPEGFKEYIIPKGAHYATENSYQVVNKTELHFLVLFDSSSIYTSIDPKNNGDINKLYGFSDCGTQHQENSARVGWVWNGKAIELYAYCYANSIRSSKLLGSIAIGTPCELTIRPEASQYRFEQNGFPAVYMKRGCNTPGISGYQLYPYFGGDETAPQEVHIYIKEL